MPFLVTFILSLLISLLFWPVHRDKKESATSLILFFLILFSAGLAAQFWIVPFGPLLMGIYWLPLVSVLLIFAFLFSIPSPYQYQRSGEQQTEEVAAAGVFSWILLLLLVIAATVGFYNALIS